MSPFCHGGPGPLHIRHQLPVVDAGQEFSSSHAVPFPQASVSPVGEKGDIPLGFKGEVLVLYRPHVALAGHPGADGLSFGGDSADGKGSGFGLGGGLIFPQANEGKAAHGDD
jgi:hypothetical protein